MGGGLWRPTFSNAPTNVRRNIVSWFLFPFPFALAGLQRGPVRVEERLDQRFRCYAPVSFQFDFVLCKVLCQVLFSFCIFRLDRGPLFLDTLLRL